MPRRGPPCLSTHASPHLARARPGHLFRGRQRWPGQARPTSPMGPPVSSPTTPWPWSSRPAASSPSVTRQTEHPFEGGAAARERDQFVVAGHRRAVMPSGRWRRSRSPWRPRRTALSSTTGSRRAAGREPGQERVECRTWRPPPVPVEGSVGGGHRCAVALHEHHVVTGPPGAQRHAQPGDARPDHHDPVPRRGLVPPPPARPPALPAVGPRFFDPSALHLVRVPEVLGTRLLRLPAIHCRTTTA